jgi:hypothetical protein
VFKHGGKYYLVHAAWDRASTAPDGSTRVAGYWSDPARVADAAVPGVVRLEWTGPEGNRLYVARPR